MNPGALDAPDVQQLTFKSEACGAGAAHASRQVRGEEPITWRRVSGPNISLSACHNVRNGEEKKQKSDKSQSNMTDCVALWFPP